MHEAREVSELALPAEALLWGAGCGVLAHVVNLFGVSYWDQSYVLWFMQLAVAASVAQYYLRNSASEELVTKLCIESPPEDQAV